MKAVVLHEYGGPENLKFVTYVSGRSYNNRSLIVSGHTGSYLVGGSNRIDIPHWRLAEEAPVLAAELTYAFVADFVRRARCIYPVHQHPLPGCL